MIENQRPRENPTILEFLTLNLEVEYKILKNILELTPCIPLLLLILLVSKFFQPRSQELFRGKGPRNEVEVFL